MLHGKLHSMYSLFQQFLLVKFSSLGHRSMPWHVRSLVFRHDTFMDAVIEASMRKIDAFSPQAGNSCMTDH
eukprot:4514153-Amphidinium_carterae.1